MEESQKTEGTEKTKGAEESGYDSDIFKKCWEDDF
jgi:hypothetical protein